MRQITINCTWPRTRSSEMDSSAMVDENLVTCKVIEV